MTPSLVNRNSGNPCSAHAYQLLFCPLFKTFLKDREKTARVYPNTGVEQGCHLSPLLFSSYINDIDEIAKGVYGAVTGTTGSFVTHMLYADDLTLMLADDLDAMQIMLNRLHWYPQTSQY